MAYRPFREQALTKSAPSIPCAAKTTSTQITTGAKSRADYYIDAKTGSGTAFTSLVTLYDDPHLRELHLDLKSYLIRAKKGQPLPDDRPETLKDFDFKEHDTFTEAMGTVQSHRSKYGLIKGSDAHFRGMGASLPQATKSSSSEESTESETASEDDPTEQSTAGASKGAETSLALQFFGIEGTGDL